ncbi:MAG: DUF3501 family protein [Bryobacterales bacterium]|nr:DUF3501 family protein [Bryobacterales bacterium]
MMQPVTIDEVRNIAEYEVWREEWRPRMIAMKDRRRVRVGGHLTFLFENHDTVLYQVQEMMRIERIVRPHEIEHEIRTYNELIPKANGLCASLLIEYETPEERAVWLRKLLGLENHVWFLVGETAPVKASFDTRQISTDRISSVQYVSFQFSPEQAKLFSNAAKLVVDHPEYTAEAVLTAAQLAELSADFR